MNVLKNIIVLPAIFFFTIPHLIPAQDPFLAVTIAHLKVHDVAIFDFETGAARNMSLRELVDPVGVAFDPVESKVYFSDRNTRILGRANLNGSDQEVLLRFGNKTVLEHIALNHRSRLLFWADAGRGAIFVSNLQFTVFKKLIEGGLVKPRGLVADSEDSYLYWSEWFHQEVANNAKIERATMTGKNREVIVERDIVWPNGITLDKAAGRLFWCDAFLDRIESVNLDGSNRTVVIENSPYLQHSYSIALYGEFIFWTDARQSGVVKAERNNGTVIDVTTLAGQPGINGLSVSSFDQGTNACSRDNGGCFSTQLCLPEPSGRNCFCLQSRDDDSSCFYQSEEPLHPITPPGERQVITIRDCPGDTTITLQAQMESVTVTWVEPVATGPDGSTLEADQSHTPGEYFRDGSTRVIYVYKFNGETAVCSFDVIVKGTGTTPEENAELDIRTILIWVGIGVIFLLFVLVIVCVSVCIVCSPRDKTFRRDGNLVAMETVENAPIDGDINTLTSQVSLSVELQCRKPNGQRANTRKNAKKKKGTSPDDLVGMANAGFHTYEELPPSRYTDYKTNFEDSGRFNTMR